MNYPSISLFKCMLLSLCTYLCECTHICTCVCVCAYAQRSDEGIGVYHTLPVPVNMAVLFLNLNEEKPASLNNLPILTPQCWGPTSTRDVWLVMSAGICTLLLMIVDQKLLT